MQTGRKVALAGIACILIVAFFFGPVLYWVSIGSWPIYRSAGCATVGLGEVYAPHFGWHLGCDKNYLVVLHALGRATNTTISSRGILLTSLGWKRSLIYYVYLRCISEKSMSCKFCGSDKTVKNGIAGGKQLYRCKACNHQYRGERCFPQG